MHRLKINVWIFPNRQEVKESLYRRSRISCEVHLNLSFVRFLHIFQYEKLNNMAKEIVPLSYFNEPKKSWLIIFLQMCGI